MTLTNRFLLTSNGNDSVGGINTVNIGNVTFSESKGAMLNGVNQCLTFAKPLVPIFSIGVWVNFEEINILIVQSIVMSSDVTGSNTGIRQSGSNMQGHVDENVATSPSNEFTATNYPASSFVFLNLDYDGTTARLYRGNTLLISKTMTNSLHSLTGWAIGRQGNDSTYYLKANVKDVTFYDSSLSTAERESIVLAGAGGVITTSKARPQII